MDRSVYDPGHITGSAFIASDDGRRTLLIHHAKLNRWLQPGGHAEAGETDARHVARREAEEEVGIVTPPDDGQLLDVDVHTIPARGDQPAHFHFDLRYLFLVPHREVRAAAEVLDARWFTLDEADAVVNEAGLRRMIAKLRARFAR
jgi:8-oxo-dGTP pyrophosphatase MutT (NUDIX family)